MKTEKKQRVGSIRLEVLLTRCDEKTEEQRSLRMSLKYSMIRKWKKDGADDWQKLRSQWISF